MAAAAVMVISTFPEQEKYATFRYSISIPPYNAYLAVCTLLPIFSTHTGLPFAVIVKSGLVTNPGGAGYVTTCADTGYVNVIKVSKLISVVAILNFIQLM
jgi:hypothetical protein